jgi:hypothetical protein
MSQAMLFFIGIVCAVILAVSFKNPNDPPKQL